MYGKESRNKKPFKPVLFFNFGVTIFFLDVKMFIYVFPDQTWEGLG